MSETAVPGLPARETIYAPTLIVRESSAAPRPAKARNVSKRQ